MNNKVEKALGEPVATDFSDYVRKIRANLIIVSAISISIALGGLEIDPTSSILGLKFNGLSNSFIFNSLLAINGYMLMHFLWCSFDAFQEWGLRVTGTRLAFITTARNSSGDGDYPSDPRQSSLYHWWKDQSLKIGSLTSPVEEINKKLEIWESKVKIALESQGNPNAVNACMSINQVAGDVAKLKKSIEEAAKLLESSRIPVSLQRFDQRFQLFLRSQNLRWLIIELLLPILMGSYSLALLLEKL